MGAVLGGPSAVRVIYCSHRHDMDDDCNERCHHGEGCQYANQEPCS